MIDNVVYERSVWECVKIGYLQQQKNTKNPNLLGSLPTPIQKSWVCHCCAAVLKMKSRRLCICVSCHFVCIQLGSFCDHCKNVWYNLFSGRPSKVLPWSWLKKSWSWDPKSWSWSWSWSSESWSWSWSWDLESWSWSWQKSLIYITADQCQQ